MDALSKEKKMSIRSKTLAEAKEER